MPSWIEILGFLTGAACVWLLVIESIWNWPVAIASNLFFIVVFWRAGLYADAGLAVIYVAISAYGWWHWLRGGPRHTHLSVSRLRASLGWSLAAVTAVFSAALALVLARYTPSTVPVWDATGAGLSLAAQFLQARKVIATWWVWIAADVLYIALYLYKGLWLTAVLYAVFMAMCVTGLLAWRRSLFTEPAPATA